MTQKGVALSKNEYIVMNFNIGWHVLYVKSRWEKKVCEALQELSLEAFLPQIKQLDSGVIERKRF